MKKVSKKIAQTGQNLLERFFIPAMSMTRPTTLEYDEERGCITAYYGESIATPIQPDGTVKGLDEKLEKTIFVLTALAVCPACEEAGENHAQPCIAIFGGYDKEGSAFGRDIEEFLSPNGTTYGDCLIHINDLVRKITGTQLNGCQVL
jgi:hypothetical protein